MPYGSALRLWTMCWQNSGSQGGEGCMEQGLIFKKEHESVYQRVFEVGFSPKHWMVAGCDFLCEALNSTDLNWLWSDVRAPRSVCLYAVRVLWFLKSRFGSSDHSEDRHSYQHRVTSTHTPQGCIWLMWYFQTPWMVDSSFEMLYNSFTAREFVWSCWPDGAKYLFYHIHSSFCFAGGKYCCESAATGTERSKNRCLN